MLGCSGWRLHHFNLSAGHRSGTGICARDVPRHGDTESQWQLLHRQKAFSCQLVGTYFCAYAQVHVWMHMTCVHVCAVCIMWQSLLNSSALPWLLNLSPYSLLCSVYLFFTWPLHTLPHTTVPLISANSSNRAVFLHWQIRIYWNVLCDTDNRFYPFLTKYKWWNNNRICVITLVVW